MILLKIIGYIGLVLWLFVAFIDLSLGCPPPPFAHRCLMKKAGVLPPYNYSNYK